MFQINIYLIVKSWYNGVESLFTCLIHLTIIFPSLLRFTCIPIWSVVESSPQEMRNELLKHDNYNVIIVDWGGGSLPLYTQATANTRLVGLEIAHLLKHLQVKWISRTSKLAVLFRIFFSFLFFFWKEKKEEKKEKSDFIAHCDV